MKEMVKKFFYNFTFSLSNNKNNTKNDDKQSDENQNVLNLSKQKFFLVKLFFNSFELC